MDLVLIKLVFNNRALKVIKLTFDKIGVTVPICEKFNS
jgi:hypothetical protein